MNLREHFLENICVEQSLGSKPTPTIPEQAWTELLFQKHYKMIISAKQNNTRLFQQTIIINLFHSCCERSL